jgi:hypothetical protein
MGNQIGSKWPVYRLEAMAKKQHFLAIFAKKIVVFCP